MNKFGNRSIILAMIGARVEGATLPLFQVMILKVSILERKVVLLATRPALKVEKPVRPLQQIITIINIVIIIHLLCPLES